MKLRPVISRVRCPQHSNKKQYKRSLELCIECSQHQNINRDDAGDLFVSCMFDLTKGVNTIEVELGAPHTYLVNRKVFMAVHCPILKRQRRHVDCHYCHCFDDETSEGEAITIACGFEREKLEVNDI